MKKLLFLFFPFVFVFSVHSIFAGISDEAGFRFSIRSWTTENGLPVNSIRAIRQTPDGFVWLATEEGLVRFDGINFYTLNPVNNSLFVDKDVHSLHIFKDSSLVAGFYHGDILSYKKLKFTRLFDRELNWIKSILSLADDPGKGLWFGTDGIGLGHMGFDGKMTFITDKQGLPNDFIQALLTAADSSLWIGTRFGLCHLVKGDITVYSTKDGLANNDIRSLCFDADGDLLIGTNGGGINIFADGKIHDYVKFANPLSQNILAIMRSADGSLWVGTNSGLFRISGNEIREITQAEGLSGTVITTIYEDREMTVWVGTDGAGLNAIRPGFVRMYTTKEGLSDNSVGPVCKGPAGTIFAGTSRGGVNEITSGGITRLEKKIGLPVIPVTSLAWDNSGTLWIGTDGMGLYGYRPKGTIHYTSADGLASDVINAVYVAKDGKLWIGAGNAGINVRNGSQFDWFNTNTGLSHDQVICFCEDATGRMWAGTNGGGINLIEKDHVTWFTTDNGIPDNVILSLLQDEDGFMWAGCAHGGLVMVEKDSVFFYNSDDGLYSDAILQILEDQNGRFWLSSNKGIFSVNRNELFAFHDGKLDMIRPVIFGNAEGMLTSECTGNVFPAGCIDARNHVWFPTPRGLASLDVTTTAPTGASLSVTLTKVMINDKEVDPAEPMVLQPGTVDMEFDYVAPTFLYPEKLRFKYMLMGFDHFWINAENRRQAYYTHIPPGEYTFKVMVAGHDGVWGPEQKLFTIEVKPFFYKSLWFIAPVILVALILIWLIVVARIRTVRARMLKRLVDERTRELQEEITRRKNLQEETFRAKSRAEEADRLKSSLITFMNQYLRTPVNNIMGFSELMLQEKNESRSEEMPRYIHDSSEELLKVLDSVMVVARIESENQSQSKVMDVLPLVEEAIRENEKNRTAEVPVIAGRIGSPGETEEKEPASGTVEITGAEVPPEMAGAAPADRVVTEIPAGEAPGFPQDLTAEEIPASPETRVVTPSVTRTGPYRILLVEDNTINAQLVKTYLGSKYELDIAANGLSAIELAENNRYDAVLMDINLGPGIDGIEVTRRLKELPGYQHIPVIAVTGFTMAGMKEKILDGGASYFLAKPFGKNMLVDLLVTVLPEEKPSNPDSGA